MSEPENVEKEREEFAAWLLSPERVALVTELEKFARLTAHKLNPFRESPQFSAAPCGLVIDVLKFPRMEAYTANLDHSVWGKFARTRYDLVFDRANLLMSRLKLATTRRLRFLGGPIPALCGEARRRQHRLGGFQMYPFQRCAIHHHFPSHLIRRLTSCPSDALRVYYPEPWLPTFHFVLSLPAILPVTVGSGYLQPLREMVLT